MAQISGQLYKIEGDMASELLSPPILLLAKLVRPRLQGVYPRDRLFRVLGNQDKMAAVWVCGPAGSGKTTLVNSYLEASKTACIWYQLDESDGDVSSFFYHLGRAPGTLLSGGSVDFPLLTPEFFSSIPVFARRFFETLHSQVQAPCAIVLDNYQEVRPEALLHQVLCTALDALVPGLRLYVCSRQKPPAELARHRANCSLHIIGWKQLQLDLDEACGIAARFVGTHYPKSDVEILHAKTDGWVAGLLLLQRGEFEDIEACRLVNHTPSEIFDYFGSVLFQRLDPDVQHSLICLSYLPRISTLTAEKLAGSNAPGILEKLHKGNAFTYRSIAEMPKYSFHPLFQEYLQSQCRKHFSPAEMRQVQSLSAAALAAEGEFNDCWQLGLAYRSEIKVDFSGDMRLSGIAVPLQPLFGGSVFRTDITSVSTFPEIYSIGVALRPGESLVLAADFELVRWSSFDQVRMHIAQPVPAAGIVDTTTILDWKDSRQIKVGAEYAVNDVWRLRAGYAFVQGIVPVRTLGPENPDADQIMSASGSAGPGADSPWICFITSASTKISRWTIPC